jgi:hypothetical protein
MPAGVVGVGTVTVAGPDTADFAVEVARTVNAVAVSWAATVSKPEELMLVLEEALPSTLQFTLWGGLPVPLTAALKDWVPPFSTVADTGDTVMQ